MGKRIISVFAAVMLCLALAACSSEEVSGSAAEQVEAAGGEREILIQGGNFYFDSEEYHVSVDEAVKIIYQDIEGAHGIHIANTNIRLRNNESIVVKFREPGRYKITCSLYCGVGHTSMTAYLVVE